MDPVELAAFLADVVVEAGKALAGGTPKDAVIAAVKGVQVKVSDDAIKEELEAADARRRHG